MLSNEKFVSKAPQAKVEAEKEKLEAYKAQYALSEKQLEVYKNKKQQGLLKNYNQHSLLAITLL